MIGRGACSQRTGDQYEEKGERAVKRARAIWRGTGLMLLLLLSMVSTVYGSGGAPSGLLRYRGEYTYGHEVRSFCPAINSQCYWVGAATSRAVHAALRKLVTESADEPYQPVCVVIEGRVDRETMRDGFAADYDGLISITRVFGRCNQTDIVTQGDLQHHRWLLHSIDGQPVDSESINAPVPELDFGESMTVSGNAGCNHFSGRAVLRENFIRIAALALTRRLCAPLQNQIENKLLQVLRSESRITIGADRQLVLASGETILRFRLFDWKN
jgi:heat shock protein HslJ